MIFEKNNHYYFTREYGDFFKEKLIRKFLKIAIYRCEYLLPDKFTFLKVVFLTK